MRIEFVGLSVGVSDLTVNYNRPQNVADREKGANRIRVTVPCGGAGGAGARGYAHCFGRFKLLSGHCSNYWDLIDLTLNVIGYYDKSFLVPLRLCYSSPIASSSISLPTCGAVAYRYNHRCYAMMEEPESLKSSSPILGSNHFKTHETTLLQVIINSTVCSK